MRVTMRLSRRRQYCRRQLSVFDHVRQRQLHTRAAPDDVVAQLTVTSLERRQNPEFEEVRNFC